MIEEHEAILPWDRDGSPYLLSLNAEVTFSHKMADKAGMILQARVWFWPGQVLHWADTGSLAHSPVFSKDMMMLLQQLPFSSLCARSKNKSQRWVLLLTADGSLGPLWSSTPHPVGGPVHSDHLSVCTSAPPFCSAVLHPHC